MRSEPQRQQTYYNLQFDYDNHGVPYAKDSPQYYQSRVIRFYNEISWSNSRDFYPYNMNSARTDRK
eukprot:9997258-Karenia_brevis.AAC.1